MHPRRRQKHRLAVNRPLGMEEIERRPAARQHQVHVIERLYRADVGPEAAIEIGNHAVGRQRRGNNLLAEIHRRAAAQHFVQHVA